MRNTKPSQSLNSHERRRLEVLRAYHILDTPPEQGFDDITHLASEVLEMPIALISLVDDSRLWFKSKVGLSFSEISREASFCSHALSCETLLIVPDAIKDSRFVDHPLVKREPFIRFYAGSPLVAPGGEVIGTLCVLDRVPRQLEASQQRVLNILSKQVMIQMELCRHLKEVEKARLHAEEMALLLSEAQGLADIGTWDYHPNSGHLYWSPETCALFGIRPEDFAGTREAFFKFVVPEDLEGLHQAHEKSNKDPGLVEVEYRIRRPNGQIRWMYERGKVVKDDQGNKVRRLGVIMDITEKKEYESSLDASEIRFRQLAESMPMIVWTASPDGEVDYLNHHFFEYTGVPTDAPPATRWQETLHPDDLEQCIQTWTGCISTGRDYNIEFRLRRAHDCVYRWFRVQALPIRDSNGNILKWYGTALDIDDVKSLERQAVDLAGSLKMTMESITDAFITMDQNWRLTYINGEAEKRFHRPREACIEKVLWEVFPDMIGTTFEKECRRAMEEEISVSFVEYYEQLEKWFETRAYPSDQGLAVSMHDITDRKRLEAQFLRAQRMESIGTLAGGIAHDLNNALAPILMSLGILKEMVENEQGQSLLQTVEQSARRGADLVRQVLAFAKGIEGQHTLVDVTYILKDLQTIVRDTFPKNIDFKMETPAFIKSVKGDPTQLHQVFINLILNARDAMPTGGRITVKLEERVVDEFYNSFNLDGQPGTYVVVTVADNGMGISKKIQGKVFEPFFTTKETGKGTGLGLSTTHAIVKSHSGFINLYSEPGNGSEFKVYLPVCTMEELIPIQDQKADIIPLGKGEWILVVDDEEAVLKVATRILEKAGYKVLTAVNGVEALSLYTANMEKIKVVLTDMAMPIMDGPATIFALKSINTNVKIIGSSGYDSKSHFRESASPLLQHFIPKPYVAESLLRIIRKVLDEDLTDKTM